MLIPQLASLGARCKLLCHPRGARVPRFDIGADREGEFLEVAYGARHQLARLQAVDLRPKRRHALLMYREAQESGEAKHKFLFGHDERHWFVAAVPERGRGVATVDQAMRALMPEQVQRATAHRQLRRKLRHKRRNPAFIRQGEWFFLPAPEVVAPRFGLLRNEPLRRGGGSKPHVLEEAFRRGGEAVWVHAAHAPQGIRASQYGQLPRKLRRRPGWIRQVREPELYARGRVRHADHATVRLRGWHRVLMNTERFAPAAQAVTFLD